MLYSDDSPHYVMRYFPSDKEHHAPHDVAQDILYGDESISASLTSKNCNGLYDNGEARPISRLLAQTKYKIGQLKQPTVKISSRDYFDMAMFIVCGFLLANTVKDMVLIDWPLTRMAIGGLTGAALSRLYYLDKCMVKPSNSSEYKEIIASLNSALHIQNYSFPILDLFSPDEGRGVIIDKLHLFDKISPYVFFFDDKDLDKWGISTAEQKSMLQNARKLVCEAYTKQLYHAGNAPNGWKLCYKKDGLWIPVQQSESNDQHSQVLAYLLPLDPLRQLLQQHSIIHLSSNPSRSRTMAPRAPSSPGTMSDSDLEDKSSSSDFESDEEEKLAYSDSEPSNPFSSHHNRSPLGPNRLEHSRRNSFS